MSTPGRRDEARAGLQVSARLPVAQSYLERRPSETDGRAAVIYQTELGRALLNDALDVVEELEREYEAHLGAERLASLKKLLSSLLAHIDPMGSLGRD